MKTTKKIVTILTALALFAGSLSAFDKGWVLNMRGNVGGSLTTPSISDTDLARLGANKMEGMTGFIGGGTAEVGYIFDNETFFNLPKEHWFSGIGAFGRIGVGQGYSGLISGSFQQGKQVDVFVNVYFTPVIELGAAAKAYFFKNRLAVGVGLGTKMIADTSPNYEIYSNTPDLVPAEVGTIIVDEWMMTHMNPFSIDTQLFAEYNVKVLDTTELILGGYMGYNIYTPKHVTMPDKVLNMAIDNFGFDPHSEMASYFLNSLNFGLTFALGFKLE